MKFPIQKVVTTTTDGTKSVISSRSGLLISWNAEHPHDDQFFIFISLHHKAGSSITIRLNKDSAFAYFESDKSTQKPRYGLKVISVPPNTKHREIHELFVQTKTQRVELYHIFDGIVKNRVVHHHVYTSSSDGKLSSDSSGNGGGEGFVSLGSRISPWMSDSSLSSINQGDWNRAFESLPLSLIRFILNKRVSLSLYDLLLLNLIPYKVSMKLCSLLSSVLSSSVTGAWNLVRRQIKIPKGAHRIQSQRLMEDPVLGISAVPDGNNGR